MKRRGWELLWLLLPQGQRELELLAVPQSRLSTPPAFLPASGGLLLHLLRALPPRWDPKRVRQRVCQRSRRRRRTAGGAWAGLAEGTCCSGDAMRRWSRGETAVPRGGSGPPALPLRFWPRACGMFQECPQQNKQADPLLPSRLPDPTWQDT